MPKKRQIGEPDVTKRRMMGPGRQTTPRGSMFGAFPYNYIPRRNYEKYDITSLEQSYLSASQLLALLPDLSSDIGLAVWNVLRLGSTGFNYTVKDPAGQDDADGKSILDGLLGRINQHGGGLTGLIVQWLQCGFLQGAISGEAALVESLQDIEDLYVIDPSTISFKRDENTMLQMWHTPPTGSANKILLNPEKSWYIPIDPWVDDPYGRPPAAPVLQEVWFDVMLIADLRKVVHNQGWPRIDIKIIEEVLTNTAPAFVKNDPEKFADWLNDRLAEIQTAYNDLQPDDTFVHYDSVEINESESGGKIFDATSVIRVIERRMTKALKQLPILMASNEGVTETHGTVQWQIFVAGLRSLQEPIGFLMSKMLQLSLEVLGRQGSVECWFEPIRTTDRKADADAESIEIKNAITKWAAGFQSWEESSIEVTGSAPPEGVEEPDPLAALGRGAPVSADSMSRINAELSLYPGYDNGQSR
jgi:hypothetical protein